MRNSYGLTSAIKKKPLTAKSNCPELSEIVRVPKMNPERVLGQHKKENPVTQ